MPSQPLKSGDTLTLGNSVVLSVEVCCSGCLQPCQSAGFVLCKNGIAMVTRCTATTACAQVWQAPEEDATVEQYLRAMQAQLQAHTQVHCLISHLFHSKACSACPARQFLHSAAMSSNLTRRGSHSACRHAGPVGAACQQLAAACPQQAHVKRSAGCHLSTSTHMGIRVSSGAAA